MLHDIKIDGVVRKVVGHYARKRLLPYTIDRTNGKFIKAESYVNDPNFDEGHRSEDGQALRRQTRRLTRSATLKRALRGDGQKRTCPTWHGGIAHQPLSAQPVHAISFTASAPKAASQNGAMVASFWSRTAASDPKKSEPRSTARPSITAP